MAGNGRFSATNQPAGRMKGSKNKKTIALAKFEELGYSPIEGQIVMLKAIQKKLSEADYDLSVLSKIEFELFLKYNEKLCSYESAKPAQEVELKQDIISGGAPLDPAALALAKTSLQDKF